METIFSGQKETYESGATRDVRTGKGRFDCIPPTVLRRLAELYERGATNHGAHNWAKGIPFSRLVDSAMRHFNQFREGKTDEDHLVQCLFNIIAIVHFQENGRKDLDDLPKWL
jgi:hypothetical protein